MKAHSDKPKPGGRCPYCGKGKLEPSASGKQLVCAKCRRVVVVREVKSMPSAWKLAIKLAKAKRERGEKLT